MTGYASADVRVRIERLVLHPPGDAGAGGWDANTVAAMVAAFEESLRELLAGAPLPASTAWEPVPSRAGRHLAQSVHAHLATRRAEEDPR